MQPNDWLSTGFVTLVTAVLVPTVALGLSIAKRSVEFQAKLAEQAVESNSAFLRSQTEHIIALKELHVAIKASREHEESEHNILIETQSDIAAALAGAYCTVEACPLRNRMDEQSHKLRKIASDERYGFASSES